MSPDISIYTAIYGDIIDLLPQAKQTIPVEWHAFTDKHYPKAKHRGWQIHHNPLTTISTVPRLQAKYLKVQPHQNPLLSSSRYTIWIDGKVVIKSPTFAQEAVEALQRSNKEIAFFKHPYRETIQDEYAELVHRNKFLDADDQRRGKDQVDRYYRKGFIDTCLLEGTIIIRDMKAPLTKKFDARWWQEIQKGSSRDQLSLTYVLWANHVKPLILEPAIRYHPALILMPHKNLEAHLSFMKKLKIKLKRLWWIWRASL